MDYAVGNGFPMHDSSDSILDSSIHEWVENDLELHSWIKEFPPGFNVLVEGEHNNFLHYILDGQIEIQKKDTLGVNKVIDLFATGDFLGLPSFRSGQASFVTGTTLSRTRTFTIDRTQFDALAERHPKFHEVLNHQFINALSDRVRRMVNLNLTITTLTEDLDRDRLQLQKTIHDLEATRNLLIHQEKMATLGQLLAGIAHEINNPCAALIRNIDQIQTHLPKFFETYEPFKKMTLEYELLLAGMQSPFYSSEEKRERMESIEQNHPDLRRTIIRRLAPLTPDLVETMSQKFGPKTNTAHDAQMEDQLRFFELGAAMRGVSLASQRIHALVQSLKNYGRPDQGTWALTDLREGLRDTIQVLNNRLKTYQIVLNFEDVPPILCHGGELNQVWTNLLVNACDATPLGKKISIEVREHRSDIFITFSDEGTGIPIGAEEKIFEANFTTKTSSGHFGLGLGLAISREIIEKHAGSITAANSPIGGAVFTVRLPKHNPYVKA